MARVVKADHRLRNIALERLGARRQKERVVLSPSREKPRLVRSEILLKGRVQGHIALVVSEQIQLHFIRARACEIEIIQRISVRGDKGSIGNTVGVLPDGGLRGQEVSKLLSIGCRGVFPICANGIPSVAQTLRVRVAVLRDEGGDSLGM